LEEFLSSSSLGISDPGASDSTKSGQGGGPDAGTAARLKAQMQADALRPLNSGSVGSNGGEDGERPLRMGTGVGSDGGDPVETIPVWPEESLLQVSDHLWLSVSRSLSFPSPTIDFVAPAPLPRSIISPFGRSCVALVPRASLPQGLLALG